MQKLGTLKNE